VDLFRLKPSPVTTLRFLQTIRQDVLALRSRVLNHIHGGRRGLVFGATSIHHEICQVELRAFFVLTPDIAGLAQKPSQRHSIVVNGFHELFD
jgi:hypothetical protein